MSGNIVGSYKLTDVIGEGNFGIVLEGVHRILDRTVALKFLKPIKKVNYFIRESRIMAQVKNEHIIDVYDVFFTDKGPCIAMEFVKGENLRTCMELFEQSHSHNIDTFGQIVSGLKALHDNDIIHRDLKPENILIKFENSQVKITDFGIAVGTENELFVTRSNASIGTLPYMSPEQLNGNVDYRSDLWSIGVMLYELLTGKLPFNGKNEIEIIDNIRKGEYEKLSAEEYPSWATKIVEGLLVINPARRIQSCEKILELMPIIKNPQRNRYTKDMDREQLLNVVLKMLPDKCFEINREELIRLSAKELGYQKTGKNIRNNFLWAIQRGIRRGLMAMDENEIVTRL